VAPARGNRVARSAACGTRRLGPAGRREFSARQNRVTPIEKAPPRSHLSKTVSITQKAGQTAEQWPIQRLSHRFSRQLCAVRLQFKMDRNLPGLGKFLSHLTCCRMFRREFYRSRRQRGSNPRPPMQKSRISLLTPPGLEPMSAQ